MIETMNKQQVEFAEFVNELWEYDLSPETDLSSSASRLDVNLCDDGGSFPPLDSGLEGVLDPPLTTLLTVAPSFPNTLWGSTAFIMTFPDTPSPFVQSTEFEVGETLGVSASVDEDDTWSESDSVSIKVHDFYGTPTGTSCVDVVVAGPTSPDFIDNISPNSLDTFHASSSCSQPSPSPKCYDMSLIDPYVILM